MKTGKITFITPDGSFENRGQVLNRYKVTLATGEVYTFNAKGEFKRQVGDEIQFKITNEQYNTASLIWDKPQVAPTQQSFKKTDDVQKYIIKQSSVASAVNFYKDKNVGEQQVLDFAEKIVNYIYK